MVADSEDETVGNHVLRSKSRQSNPSLKPDRPSNFHCQLNYDNDTEDGLVIVSYDHLLRLTSRLLIREKQAEGYKIRPVVD